jgi:hypothetical protein
VLRDGLGVIGRFGIYAIFGAGARTDLKKGIRFTSSSDSGAACANERRKPRQPDPLTGPSRPLCSGWTPRSPKPNQSSQPPGRDRPSCSATRTPIPPYCSRFSSKKIFDQLSEFQLCNKDPRMGKVRADEALKGLDTDTLLTMAFDSADWPTVIMIGSFLEILLERAITSRFDPDEPGNKINKEQLFDGHGPLATFSSKINIAYAFGLISKSSRDDLNIIKAIRNNAAHRIDHFSFENKDVKQRCSSLSSRQPANTSDMPNVDKKMRFLSEKN